MSSIPFWFNDPSILLNKEHIHKIWPNPDMKYKEKLNAITRLVIILSILGYVLTNSYKMLLSCLFTLGIIVMLYKTHNKNAVEEYLYAVENIGESPANSPLLEKDPFHHTPMMSATYRGHAHIVKYLLSVKI